MKKIIWLLIFAFLVYTGIKFGMPYYRYVAFKSEAKEIAKISVGIKQDEIKNRVFERAQELKIPIQKDDIELSTTEKMVQIRTSWFEVVDILGQYQKTLIFSIDTEQ
jgi:hypothetical protein